MASPRRLTKKSLSGSSPNSPHEVSAIPRGTPPEWLMRLQLAANLTDRLEMIHEPSDRRYVLKLAGRSVNLRDLIRRYSNDSML